MLFAEIQVEWFIDCFPGITYTPHLFLLFRYCKGIETSADDDGGSCYARSVY